ncbi:MAG: hypothetical protein ABI904_03165 [Chloroflexota bacterium]
MSSSNRNPKWWRLYLVFPVFMALFAVDSRLKISTRGHQALQIGIILFVYELVHLWLKANARAQSRMDQKQDHGTIRVVRIPSYQLTELDKDNHPLFQLPHTEIKGVLSNTFEIDYIDAEFFPVDEAQQQLNKE